MLVMKRNMDPAIFLPWVNNKEERPWGHFKILYRDDGVKVKEIVIAPVSPRPSQSIILEMNFGLLQKEQLLIIMYILKMKD